MKNYYVLEIWDDARNRPSWSVRHEQERDECFEQLRAADPARRNGVYALSCTGAIELAVKSNHSLWE